MLVKRMNELTQILDFLPSVIHIPREGRSIFRFILGQMHRLLHSASLKIARRVITRMDSKSLGDRETLEGLKGPFFAFKGNRFTKRWPGDSLSNTIESHFSPVSLFSFFIFAPNNDKTVHRKLRDTLTSKS